MTQPKPDDRNDNAERIQENIDHTQNRNNADTWQDLSAPMGETTV